MHGLGAPERLHAVLQQLQVTGHLLPHHVRPCSEELAELHPAWPEPVECIGQPRRAAGMFCPPPLDQIGNAMRQPRTRRQVFCGKGSYDAFARQHIAGADHRKA